MNPARRASIVRWCLLGVLWAGFTLWYTNLGGPLTEAEIEGYLSRLAERGGPPEVAERLAAFMRSDDGNAFVMVNALDLVEPGEMRPDGARSGGGEADLGRYMEHMWPELLGRACHPLFMGRALGEALDLAGVPFAAGGAARWDQAALMRYRSRRDMVEIALDPAFRPAHGFKLAALTKTIAFPVSTVLNPAEPRLWLALVLVLIGLIADRVRSPTAAPSRFR